MNIEENQASEVTAINVFVEVGGRQHIAILDSQMAKMFLGMLGAYQRGQPDGARLTVLPDDVCQKLLETRRALSDHFMKAHRGAR